MLTLTRHLGLPLPTLVKLPLSRTLGSSSAPHTTKPNLDPFTLTKEDRGIQLFTQLLAIFTVLLNWTQQRSLAHVPDALLQWDPCMFA